MTATQPGTNTQPTDAELGTAMRALGWHKSWTFEDMTGVERVRAYQVAQALADQRARYEHVATNLAREPRAVDGHLAAERIRQVGQAEGCECRGINERPGCTHGATR